MNEYYKILGLENNASLDQVKEMYRKLSFQFHPDRNPGDTQAENNFKKVQEAYSAILSPKKHHQKFQSNYTEKKNYSIFDDIFNININQTKKAKGKDLFEDLELTLNEVYSGVQKIIKINERGFCNTCSGCGFSDWKPCSACFGSGKTHLKKSPFNIMVSCNICSGSGRNGKLPCLDCSGQGNLIIGTKEITVDIPNGVDDGNLLRIPNAGIPIINGTPGDLYFKFKIKEHEFYKRDKLDLYLKIPITYSELIMGIKLNVPCINGKIVLLDVLPQSSLNNTYRIKNMGLINKNKIGDLLVSLYLITPEKLTDNYKKLITELSLEENNLADRSFLNVN